MLRIAVRGGFTTLFCSHLPLNTGVVFWMQGTGFSSSNEEVCAYPFSFFFPSLFLKMIFYNRDFGWAILPLLTTAFYLVTYATTCTAAIAAVCGAVWCGARPWNGAQEDPFDFASIPQHVRIRISSQPPVEIEMYIDGSKMSLLLVLQ